MPISSRAPSTASTAKRRASRAVPSPAAWELVLDQLRLKLKEKPSRWAMFGRAGLPYEKTYWMRRQPNLRADVIVKLAKACRVKPGTFLSLMLKHTKTDPEGVIQW